MVHHGHTKSITLSLHLARDPLLKLLFQLIPRCEGDLPATSATPLIAGVDSTDLAC